MKRIIVVGFILIIHAVCSTVVCAQNVAINTTGAAAAPSAMLDVAADSMGILIPRVSLTDTADVATIIKPDTSLVVYNSNVAMTGGIGEGFYSFDGARWVPLVQATSSPGTSGQVLASQGTGVMPEWKPDTISGSGANSNLGVGGCSDCPIEISAYSVAAADWQGVAQYCRTLVEGGHSNWRIPTVEELAHLAAVGTVLGVFEDELVYTASRVEMYNSGTDYKKWFVMNPLTGEKNIEVGTGTGHKALCVR